MMQRKIKKGEKPKFSKNVSTENKGCPGCPAFSFQYLTTSKQYNLEYFKDKREKNEARGALIDRLIEISNIEWQTLHGLGKQNGVEVLRANLVDLKPKPSGYDLGKDENIIVMRFKKQDYRILGIRPSACATLYIFAFDFNFSAYNHGS